VARIDAYIQAFMHFGAAGAIMESDEKVTLLFPQGNRFASQSTPHALLVSMLQEVAPPGAPIRCPGHSTFTHLLDGRPFVMRIEATAASWRVEIEPGGGAAPAPSRTAAAPPVRGRTIPMMAAVRPPAPEAPPAPPPPPPAPPPEPVFVAPEVSDESIEAAGPIDHMLLRLVQLGASDLHLTSEHPPMVRLHGQLGPLAGHGVIESAQLMGWLMEITPQPNQEEFRERSDTDFAHHISGVSRFRVNLFRDSRGPGGVFRVIPYEIVPADRLGVPPRVLELCDLPKGLVLVTGPTGSGKSTTLAALVDHINNTRSDHIITIEDPIEFVHVTKRCLVNQREVRTHTSSFKHALRAALREDPDIVLVGEMRDLETIEMAVETAETGHLVFGTLHTTTAPSTVDRIIDQFPGDRQEQIRQMLSESLRGVIAQTLCRRIGGGRVAAYEILIGTPAVSNLIRERKTFQLFSVMQTSKNAGMNTMNDSLHDLVKRGVVEPREAYLKSVGKAELRAMLQRDGLTAGLGD
jgi:twitching motility protein PilT